MKLSFQVLNPGNLLTGRQEVSLYIVPRNQSTTTSYQYVSNYALPYTFDYNPNALSYSINGNTRIIPTLQTRISPQQAAPYDSYNEFYRLTKAPRDFYIDMRGITSAKNPYSVTNLYDFIDSYFSKLEQNTNPSVDYLLLLSISNLNQNWLVEIISHTISLDSSTRTYFTYNFRFRVLSDYSVYFQPTDPLHAFNSITASVSSTISNALNTASEAISSTMSYVQNAVSSIETASTNILAAVSNLNTQLSKAALLVQTIATFPATMASAFITQAQSLVSSWKEVIGTLSNIEVLYTSVGNQASMLENSLSCNPSAFSSGNNTGEIDPIQDHQALTNLQYSYQLADHLRSIISSVKQADYIIKKYIITSQVHTISFGETISSIAKKYNVEPAVLISMNGLEYPYISTKQIINKNVLYVGKQMLIPNASISSNPPSAILPCADFAYNSKTNSTVYSYKAIDATNYYLISGVSYNRSVVFADIDRMMSTDQNDDINGYGIPIEIGSKVSTFNKKSIENIIKADPRINNSVVDYSIDNKVVSLNVDLSTWYDAIQ